MPKKIPLRQCIGCNSMKEKKEMLRIVKSENDAIALDRTGRLNGRGAYICSDPNCFTKARKTKGLERSFKTRIPNEVYESLEKEFDATRSAESI